MACYSRPDEEISVRVYANDEDESAVRERGCFDLLREMLENDEFADLELQSKEGSIVKANKQVLARTSPVIRLALQTDKTHLFHTERWSEAAIRQVLNFLYLGQADLSLYLSVDVAQMARELGLERLQIQALAFMKFNLKKFVNEETVSIDSETFMLEFTAEMRNQKDAINNNQAFFHRTLAKFALTEAKSPVENQVTRSTRTQFRSDSQEVNSKLQWPVYQFDSQTSTLSCSRVETPELPCEEDDLVTATVNDDEIFLLATTRSRKETHFYRAKLVTGAGDQQIAWTRHPKIAQERLFYPVILDGMVYAVMSHWCYRLSLNDSSADWESFELNRVDDGFGAFHVMSLAGRRQVVCPYTRCEKGNRIIRIFALDNTSTRPNVIEEAQFKPFAPSTSLVASETLYLFTRSNQLFEFNSLTMEITQFTMVDRLRPELWNPLTSLKVDQDVAVVLSHENDDDLDAPGIVWRFCLKTCTWQRLTYPEIKKHF